MLTARADISTTPTESGRRGTATVEMALVAPVLILLLFGIIEFGLLLSTLIQLNNLTRQGARVAATGAVIADIQAHMNGSAGMVDESQVTATMEYRVRSGGTWTEWTTLTDDGEGNSAPKGAQIRVTTEYPHELIVGSLFSDILNATDNTVTLNSSATMRRE